MADNDIFSSLFGSQNQEQPPNAPPSAAVPSGPTTNGSTESPSSTGNDVFSGLFGGSSTNSSQNPSPNNGQPNLPVPPPQHLYQDENQPWYKRAGDWLNTPTVDFEHAMSPEGAIGKAFGRTSEPGGIERGVENIVSGFTAPLSIALTLGTFGTGGLLESAGATALKEAGGEFAENLPQIIKGAQAAVDAYKTAPEGATAIADAVKAAGVDPALWNRAQSFLHDNGLSEHDLLGGDLIDRGAFQILRKVVPDLPVAATARAAKTAKTLMNAGFTYQQLESASAMSPRFLDALKEGDYDKAMEYGTEVFASGALGILGTSHALHSAGELFKPLIENNAFRPNDEWLAIDRANKEREAQHAVAEQEAVNLDRQTREILGHAEPGFLETVFGSSEEAKNRKNLELATVFHNVVTGGDRVKAAQWYNALSEALGREDRLPVPGESGPNNGQLPPAAPNEDVQKLASNYTASAGIDKIPHEGLLEEVPIRAGTKVVHSNDAGEVRVGEDGRPVVWLDPTHWEQLTRMFPSFKGTSGGSFSPAEAERIISSLVPNNPVKELFSEAQKASKQRLLTTSRTPELGNEPDKPIRVAAEELQHTWQRELSQDGEIATHLNPEQWNRLSDILPKGQTTELNKYGYSSDPVTRVAETAAKFRAGIIPETVSPIEATQWLNEYYKEVKAKHGDNFRDEAFKINEIARQHVKDIYDNRRARQVSENGGVADAQASRGIPERLREGASGPTGVGQEEPQGSSRKQTGLTSREEQQEFGKLSRLGIRGGMGDTNSAGLVTGDNEVLVGRYHDDLAKEAGYKEPAAGKGNIHDAFFRDGGVRIRGAGGVVHIDFMDPNADTFDRVYQAVQSVPDANRYYVDFRPPKGSRAVGFNISAFDKDNLLFQLKDLEEGKQTPAPVGSVAYFRNGMFSRERENETPQWYLKSNSLIDQRMQGPMPADTVLKMLENNGVKPDELKYTGLAELLHEKGKEPVRPEELKKFLDANNLQIQEVTKGARPGAEDRTVFRSGADTREKLMSWVNGDEALTRPDGSLRPGLSVRKMDDGTYNLWDERGPANNEDGNPTKFGSYTLPGGSNYREITFSLPGFSPQLDEFEEPHWNEKAQIGHVRVNDRVGPNGEKLLHLEEMQSYLHQQGRKKGYQPTNAEARAAFEETKKYAPAVRKAVSEAGITPNGPEHRELVDDVLSQMSQAKKTLAQAWFTETGTHLNPELADDVQKYFDASDVVRREGSRTAVPDAPFKKTWPELLFKRMIRYAAEHGYDGISWTPGEEQAARYDLSKQVDSVKYAPKERLLAAQKDGRNVIEKENVKPEDLPDLIGKEAARKLLETDTGSPLWKHHLSGQDLKVGGEGMKGFYDKIVPEMANKLGKQFGAKVGETTIRPTDVKPGSFTEEFLGRKPDKKVPYFPITDSMRESVMKQGQPLFSRESPNNGQDEQLRHQIDTNVFKNQPKDYQDLVMDSLRRNAMGELSDREIQASKKLRDEQDRNYEIGSSNDLLHHYIEDYMTRVYKDTNPEGRVILSNAKGGRFATNVTMAKQRVYDSNLTALLKSPKQMLLDPVQITAQGRASLIKAAANRQLIDSLRDKFTRASDGRPAVVLSGSGQVVSGQNGEDPSIFVDPNRVRKINIDPKVIEQLSASGDLDRYLANGTIRDITPYVRPNNIGAAIDRLEEQAGRSTPIPDEHGQNPLRTQIMLLKSMQANGDFRGLKDFNDALTKKYAWDPQDYVSLANNALKGWNFITNSPDGTPVYVRSDIKVHPEFAEYLQNRLGLAPSEIAKHPIGKALLGAGSKLKQTLLSLSPFHLVQEALRGIMVGVNPFRISEPDILRGEKVDPSDPNSPTVGRKLVENGLTIGTDYRAKQSSSEGVSSGGGILNTIPGVGKVIGNSLNWYQDFLFDRYIPGLKYRAAELMYHEYRRLHPDWSVDRIAKAAALHANDTFGGINWRAMGRSATTQDWGRLMLLAPDWLESEMRSGARLFNKEEGGLGRAQVAKMALGLWGIARVLNLVTTGNAHYEAPFGLATKNKEGKETIFSIRTLPTDLLHAASDPVGFIKGRLSPTVRMGQELVSERDQFGRKLQPQDLWVDVFRNMAPIPLQAVGQALSGQGPEIGNFGQAVKAVGGTAMVYRTPAQKMAADLASNHTPDGVVDPASMERHRRLIDIEDKARAGEINWADLYKLAYATDQITPEELKRIETNVKNTQGMDPGMAALYTRASRLPASDYLSLYDQMNSSERAALRTLTLKVQKRYLLKARKDETPEERAKDPTFQRFLSLVPMRPAVNQ